jgi:hypothetical protein
MQKREIEMKTGHSSYQADIVREIKGTPEEYLPNLLQIVRIFRESVTLTPADESLKRGLREAILNQTQPLKELWTGIDIE